ncbi:MAG TPA: hypothetical protein VM582_01630 [Candidatus Thermoplasmatota archaeon]|nr:hypothetical protein [Candidatus Thermoplasmatota archaeon]
MPLKEREVERAQTLVEEALSAFPPGLPSIALVDHLRRWGYAPDEGSTLLERLQEEGRIGVERGRYVLRR